MNVEQVKVPELGEGRCDHTPLAPLEEGCEANIRSKSATGYNSNCACNGICTSGVWRAFMLEVSLPLVPAGWGARTAVGAGQLHAGLIGVADLPVLDVGVGSERGEIVRVGARA